MTTDRHLWLTFVVAGLIFAGCESAMKPKLAAVPKDTGTTVAFYGLVSWSAHPDPSDPTKWSEIFALLPNATGDPYCLGSVPAPHKHHPVLKIVKGSFAWKNNKELPPPPFTAPSEIYSIANRDITIEDNGFDLLMPANFATLSSNRTLETTRHPSLPFTRVPLDTALLGTLSSTESRLATRVRFVQGRIEASATVYCHPHTPLEYLAAPNTGLGCPTYYVPAIGRANLAEEVVATMSATGKSLTVHFRDWTCTGGPDDCVRVLTVSPSSPGEGVRIELSNQMTKAAKHPDSRVENSDLCDSGNYLDYLWYYNLRSGNCPEPAYFPCDTTGLGGTKCPEHDWGP